MNQNIIELVNIVSVSDFVFVHVAFYPAFVNINMKAASHLLLMGHILSEHHLL